MLTQQKRQDLANYKKQERTLQLKKMFLLRECQKQKETLDGLRLKVNS